MMKRLSYVLVIWLALSVLAVPVLGGPLQDVPPGGDVFIGEQNLTLTGIPSGTILSWYADSRIVGQSAPAATVNVGNNATFYIAPSDFTGHTGNWYIGNSTQVGLVVNDPVQTIFIYDQTYQNDVTNKSALAGDYLTFRVETNMNVIPGQRPGAAGFFTIRVRSPDGTVYSQLVQNETSSLDLEDLAPDTMPWFWVPLSPPLAGGSGVGWSTGFMYPGNIRVYPPGHYTVWTESDLNGMKTNYRDASGNEFRGKTVSAIHTVTVASDTVHIEVNNKTVIRGKPFTVTITGQPGSTYYLWLKGTSSMTGKAGDQPPGIIFSQEGVRTDPKSGPWPIGQYVFKGSTKTIQQDVAQFYGREDVRGVTYYATVTLSGTGTRTVGFSTTKDTYNQRYTIRAERPDPYDPPSSDTGTNRTFKTGEAGIGVEKGDVDVEDQPSFVRVARTYYLGDEITFTGTNTETPYTYLFITGPNLPKNGGQMTDPEKPVVPDEVDTYARAAVDENDEWEYPWETSSLHIDSGAYTIYAVTEVMNKSGLADTDGEYDMVSVMLRKPFISARLSPAVVAAGDKVSIQGIAPGQPEQGIAVWILGKNKVIYQAPGVNTDGTFEQEISKAQTADMAPGQYFVIVQHPMYNEIFDVWPASSVDGYNNNDLVAGSYPMPGSLLFRLQGEGSLQGSDAAEALVRALNNPAVDDIYAKLIFIVEVPDITVLPVTEKQVGDRFNISGTTNLATGDIILVQVTSSSFKPTTKTGNGEFSGVSGTVNVRKGIDGRNRWAFPVDSATFRPDEYNVQVSGITVGAQASARFSVVEFNPETHRTISDQEIPVEPDTEIPNETPAGTNPDDDNDIVNSEEISVGVKASKLAGVIGSSTTTPVPVSVAATTTGHVINATPQAVMAGTTAPVSRPTVQPGFGISVALTCLVFVVSRLMPRR